MKKTDYYTLVQASYMNHASSFSLLFISLSVYFGSNQSFQADTRFAQSELLHLFYAQFYHLSIKHLCLNLLGLALISWGWANQLTPFKWLVLWLFSLWAAPLWLVLIEPITWYAGLSGALHAQFSALLLLSLASAHSTKRNHSKFQSITPTVWLLMMAAGLILKLGLELYSTGNEITPFNELIAYEAHRGGTALGILIGLLMHAVDRMHTNHA